MCQREREYTANLLAGGLPMLFLDLCGFRKSLVSVIDDLTGALHSTEVQLLPPSTLSSLLFDGLMFRYQFSFA